jgi:hypothetical protein
MPKSVELMESETAKNGPTCHSEEASRRVASTKPYEPNALDVFNDVPKLFDINLPRSGRALFCCLVGDNLDAHIGILL